MGTQSKTWKTTGFRNLYRHQSGSYYGRISPGGKLSSRNLRAKDGQIALNRAEEAGMPLSYRQTEPSDTTGSAGPMPLG